MRNNLSAVLILCMSTVCLSGCDLLRVTGPCYGVGCPGGTEGRNGQYKPGEAPKAQNAAAPTPAKSAAAPSQTASTTSQPGIVQPNAPAQPAATNSPAASASAQSTSAQAETAPSAPAQVANAEAKPSPFHAIGEFFEHLIPHHNSGANSSAGSGAGN
ncbi:MAG: hypothetical protein WBS17_13550 [Candidatus Acidiferrales bacterium]